MREHPVPQDITGYQFHIIGNMTIKQFAEVLAGVLIGLGIYATNLPDILKWPLIAISVAVGALAAFVPIEEQPIDHWIVTFISALYKPTQFYWRREAKIPAPFLFKPNQAQAQTETQVDLTSARSERIHEYLYSLDPAESRDTYDVYQDQRLSNIISSFSQIQVTQTINQVATKPRLEVKPRVLSDSSQFAADLSQTEEEVGFTSSFQSAIDLNTTFPDQQLIAQQAVGVENVAQEVTIPEQPLVRLTPTEADVTKTTQPTVVAEEEVSGAYFAQETPQTTQTDGLQSAVTNSDLPFPSVPAEPNKIVGMTLTPRNELINDAIIEIRDNHDQIVRAVKSNSLGQFFITTPLQNGNYVIAAEKDGFQFPEQQLILTGALVPPVELHSSF